MIPFAEGNAEFNVTIIGKLLPGEILALEASIVKIIGGSGVGAAGEDEDGLQLKQKKTNDPEN